MLLRNVTLATMEGGLGLQPASYLRIEQGRIAAFGPERDLPPNKNQDEVIDGQGRLLTPGLIDCHTHLVHAGSRANEWEMRLAGATYQEIASAGGGILSTVTATRAATESELLRLAQARLDCLIREGVTTVEVKSGYGLELASERKMLAVARQLQGASVVTSFLAAHATPPEFKGRSDDYISACIEWMRELAAEGLVDAVDAFCETVAFTPDQVSRLFGAAQQAGLPVKLHADQLTDSGGAALAARFRAVSADHLEFACEGGLAKMAEAGTVAALLPGAYYCLRERQAPPVEAMRRHRVRMAVATDLNPGTSPLHSLLLALHMSCTLFGLTPEEALLGATVHAAAALGKSDRGRIAVGARADLALWDVDHPREIISRPGASPLSWRNAAEEPQASVG